MENQEQATAQTPAEAASESKPVLTKEQLEAQLSKNQTLSVIYMAIAVIFFAGFIILLVTGRMIISLIVLVPGLLFFGLSSSCKSAVKELLSSNIVTAVLNEVFEDVDYKPGECISGDTVNGSGMVFPFDYQRVSGSDHITAKYKGMNVELSDIELTHVECTYNEQEEKWEETTKRNFKGQWLVCDFGKEFYEPVYLSANHRQLRKQHKNECITMENQTFNDRFIVMSKNPQEAFYVLTPHMMEYIMTAADKCGGDVYMAFLTDGKLHVASKTGRDFFELGSDSTDVDALRTKFLGELRWFTDIIDELHVEDRV